LGDVGLDRELGLAGGTTETLQFFDHSRLAHFDYGTAKLNLKPFLKPF
jgi:hypothetical protein